jgi:hypothetical protein
MKKVLRPVPPPPKEEPATKGRPSPPPPPASRLSAFISLDLDLLDTVTPTGRGKRLDATFRDDFEEKKVRVEIEVPKKPKK